MQKTTLVLIAAAWIAGCAGSATQTPTLSADEQTQYASISPTQLLANAEGQLQKANEAEFAIYAPAALTRIEAQLRDLRSYSQKPDADKTRIIALCKSVDRDFQAGLANKQVAQAQLVDVFEQKQVLDQLQASKADPGDYQDAVEDMIGLVKYIEAGKADKARDKTPGVMAAMKKLEIRVVKANHLSKAKNTLAKAKDQDADDLAEKSYETAIKAYERANQFIESKPRDHEEITRLSAEALFYAKRAVWIGEEVTKLQKVKPDEMETVALDIEQLLHRIGTALHQDLRDLSPYEQSVALSSIAEKLAANPGAGQGSHEPLDKAKTEVLAAPKSMAEPRLVRTESTDKPAQEGTPLPVPQSSPVDRQQPTTDPVTKPETGKADASGANTPSEAVPADAPEKAAEALVP